jgi:hypothetical protein
VSRPCALWSVRCFLSKKTTDLVRVVELLWRGGSTKGDTEELTVQGIDLKRLRSDVRLLDAKAQG